MGCVVARAAKAREAPDWVKRLAPYLFAVPAVIVGLAFVVYIPPPNYASALYIVSAFGVSLAIWLALGTDEIPGRKEGQRRRRALRLLGMLLFLGVLGAAYGLNELRIIGSCFGWILVTAGVKAVYIIEFHERLVLCVRCGATRWFIRAGQEYYCPRCGMRLPPEVSARVA